MIRTPQVAALSLFTARACSGSSVIRIDAADDPDSKGMSFVRVPFLGCAGTTRVRYLVLGKCVAQVAWMKRPPVFLQRPANGVRSEHSWS